MTPTDGKAMKRIISGTTYNTETATLIHRSVEAYWQPDPKKDRIELPEELYRTRHGEFFMVETNIAVNADGGPSYTMEDLRPLTQDEALDWIHRTDGGDEVLETSVLVPLTEVLGADESGESRFTLRIPDVLKKRIDALARARGQSTNAWIIRALERMAAANENEERER